ncbi:MAG: alcohol dehydrogenase catalytic domain-containing protein [Promethearchaeota archaeon]
MRAILFDGKKLALKDIEKPKISDDQILIKVKAAGICGTDLAISKGDLATPTPIVLGHEFAGEVVEIGRNVNSNWMGKRVTSEINANIDFNCNYCQQKIFTQCISRKAIGIDIDGAFAEYLAVDSYLLHEIPEEISFKEATFIEPLAAAYQIFEMMPLNDNDKTIAIFGAGKLGLLIAQVSNLKGLQTILIDGSAKKLELGRNFGVKHTINRLQVNDLPYQIKQITNGIGADITLDATGNPNALSDIIKSCKTRGKIHIKSTHGLDTKINLTDMVVREITLYTSRCGPFEKAIEGIKSGQIKVKELISKEYPLEKFYKAFSSYEISRDHIKTIFTI